MWAHEGSCQNNVLRTSFLWVFLVTNHCRLRLKKKVEQSLRTWELWYTLRDASRFTLDFKCWATARFKCGRGRPTPLKMIWQCSSSSQAPVTLPRWFAIPLLTTISISLNDFTNSIHENQTQDVK
jgi:hypothetical protein